MRKLLVFYFIQLIYDYGLDRFRFKVRSGNQFYVDQNN